MPIATLEVGNRRIGFQTGDRYREKSRPFLWPLAGDYPIYDKYLYTVMTADEERASAYHEAIRRVAANKTVVEIGTGDQAHWARACAKAGALHVYAIEENIEALEKASALIQEEGLSDRITLLRGTSTELDLPEKVDLSVSEIIGEIGSSEGAIAILNDVRRRFLKPNAGCVPQRCNTYCVPFQLPDEMVNDPIVERMGIPYIEKIFGLAGSPFDIRLTLDNSFDEIPDHMLAEPAILEALDFETICDDSDSRALTFEISKAGKMNGLLLWIELYADDSIAPMSSLVPGSNWIPVFCPLFDPGVSLDEGSSVEIQWSRSTSSDGIHPDYEIECFIQSFGDSWESQLRWPHLGGTDSFHQNRLYTRLFPSL